MLSTGEMLNFMSIEQKLPKFGLQRGFHTSLPFLGAPIASDKQFPVFKQESKPTVVHNYNTPKEEMEICDKISSHVDAPRKQPQTYQTCNSVPNKKKKKKRRRRRKKYKQQNQQRTPRKEEIPVQRQRQVSVTESEDSFVIFFGEEEERLSEFSEDETETTEDCDSCESLLPIKKVRFASKSKLCEVHPMVMWSYAYQAARKGPWEEYARDRDRFNKRVIRTEAVIAHVFAPEHRSKIYQQRFASL